MKAGEYVKVLDAVESLETEAYYEFDMLWKKLWQSRGTDLKLTKEECEVMDFCLRAIQDLGYIRGALEEVGKERSGK